MRAAGMVAGCFFVLLVSVAILQLATGVDNMNDLTTPQIAFFLFMLCSGITAVFFLGLPE